MVQLVGLRGGTDFTRSFQFGSTITTGGTPQLLLPSLAERTYLLFQNTSDIELRLGFGGARARVAVSGGACTTFTVTNSGFGYTKPPTVHLIGGIGGGLGFPEPAAKATAVATLTSGEVTAITIQNGGSGYTAPPFVFLENAPGDFSGAFKPSATAGYQILPGGSYVCEASTVLSDAVTLFGATTGKTYEIMVA